MCSLRICATAWPAPFKGHRNKELKQLEVYTEGPQEVGQALREPLALPAILSVLISPTPGGAASIQEGRNEGCVCVDP